MVTKSLVMDIHVFFSKNVTSGQNERPRGGRRGICATSVGSFYTVDRHTDLWVYGRGASWVVVTKQRSKVGQYVDVGPRVVELGLDQMESIN